MCEIDLNDEARFWDDDKRRARRRHQCHSCRSFIEPGQEYIRHTSMGGDDTAPSSENLCMACDAIMTEFGAVEGHPHRTTPMSLTEFITDCINVLHEEESVYDEEKDEYVPGPTESHWRKRLEEIEARRSAAKEARP